MEPPEDARPGNDPRAHQPPEHPDDRLFDPGPVAFERGPFEILVVEDDPEPQRNRPPIVMTAIVTAVLTSALTVLALFLAGVFDRPAPRVETIVQRPVAVEATVESPGDVVSAVAEAAIPSIVTVQQFNAQTDVEPRSSGSGVVYRSDGYILTNDHVIAGAAAIKVVFADGLTYPAEVVGTDPVMDIAVLRVPITGLPPIALGDLATMKIGDAAIAVGNPLGLDGGPSVTSGVISAFDRTLATNGFGGANNLFGLLQTDAPITRGSSGGALLDSNARLIGITTAIGVSDVGAEGLGFAVPVDLVRGIADDLISQGRVRHAFLGIDGRSAFIEQIDGSEVPIGAEIRDLLPDSALGAAGAQIGDVIVALDGEAVDSMILLVARLRSYRAGEMITVTLDRGGEAIDVTLELGERTS